MIQVSSMVPPSPFLRTSPNYDGSPVIAAWQLQLSPLPSRRTTARMRGRSGEPHHPTACCPALSAVDSALPCAALSWAFLGAEDGRTGERENGRTGERQSVERRHGQQPCSLDGNGHGPGHGMAHRIISAQGREKILMLHGSSL